MAKNPNGPELMAARIEFACLDPECGAPVAFRLMEIKENKGRVACPECRRPYEFDSGFIGKLERLERLLVAVKAAEDILGDANIAVTTPNGEVKVPYRLLLTRLNTVITLDVGGENVDFHFRVEPLNDGAYR